MTKANDILNLIEGTCTWLGFLFALSSGSLPGIMTFVARAGGLFSWRQGMKPTQVQTHTDNHMSFRETGKDRQREIQQAREGFRQHTSPQVIQQAILRQNGGAK